MEWLETSFLWFLNLATHHDGILIGWILGIISAPLTMFITNYFKGSTFSTVLYEELMDAKIRLLALMIVLHIHLNSFTQSNVSWLFNQLDAHPDNEEYKSSLDLLEKLNNLTEEEFIIVKNQIQRDPQNTKSIPPFKVPYLESNITSIGLLTKTKQKFLVRFLHFVSILNDKISDVRQWDRMTFDGQTLTNHTMVVQNSQSSKKAIVEIAEKACKCIDDYLAKI